MLDFSSLLTSTFEAPATFLGFGFSSSSSNSVNAYKAGGSLSASANPPGSALTALYYNPSSNPSSNSSFTIDVLDQAFDTVSFNGGTASGSITATAYTAANALLGSGGPGGFGGASYWDTAATKLGSYATNIKTVSFTATQFFSIANITFSLSTDTGGGGGGSPVPEPASFGLVALALLAAGAMSKRRKSA